MFMGMRSEVEYTKWSVTATSYIKTESINHNHIMTDGLCTNTQNNTEPPNQAAQHAAMSGLHHTSFHFHQFIA